MSSEAFAAIFKRETDKCLRELRMAVDRENAGNVEPLTHIERVEAMRVVNLPGSPLADGAPRRRTLRRLVKRYEATVQEMERRLRTQDSSSSAVLTPPEPSEQP